MNMKRCMHTWETVYFFIGVAGILIGIGVGVMMERTPLRLTGNLQPCLLYTFFRIPCPGCGGTRAVEYLLQGRVWDSFLAHPLVLYAAISYLYFMAAYSVKTFYRKQIFYFWRMPLRKHMLVGACVVLVGQWILKLIYW